MNLLTTLEKCIIQSLITRKKYIPDIEAAFPNPGNAFRFFGNCNELAETCVGFPSEPMMVTIPPNKT